MRRNLQTRAASDWSELAVLLFNFSNRQWGFPAAKTGAPWSRPGNDCLA